MLGCIEKFDINLLLASLAVPFTGVGVLDVSSAEADKQIAASVTNANKVFEAFILSDGLKKV